MACYDSSPLLLCMTCEEGSLMLGLPTYVGVPSGVLGLPSCMVLHVPLHVVVFALHGGCVARRLLACYLRLE